MYRQIKETIWVTKKRSKSVKVDENCLKLRLQLCINFAIHDNYLNLPKKTARTKFARVHIFVRVLFVRAYFCPCFFVY